MCIKDQFILKKIHSLTGVVPLGLFLLEHIYTNSFAINGPAAFNGAVEFLHSLPYLFVFELVLIFIPITFHTLYGVWRIYEVRNNVIRNNVIRYNYLRNWLFYLQRISGLIMFIFVIYHLYSFKIMSLFYNVDITYEFVASSFNNISIIIFYIVGFLSTAFHFANGLWNFGITWGITIGSKAQYYSTIACTLIFALLGYAGFNVLLHFIR